MSGMRKWLCLFLGVAFAAFAAPSFATGNGKLFSFTIDPAALDWNNSPQNSGGQSVMNSIELIVPSNFPVTINGTPQGYGFQITGWTGGVGNLYDTGTNATAPTSQTQPVTLPYNVLPGHYLWIKGITGVGPGSTFQVFIKSMTDAGCSGSFTLQGEAWTGNTWGGTAFTPSPAGADVTPLPCFGNLVCAVLQNNINPDLDGNQHSSVGRGQFDSTGNDCGTQAVPYTSVFINNPGTAQTFVLNEASGAQHPTGEYVISWNAVALSAWPSNFQPQVAWLNKDGSPANQPGTPAYINAVACAGDDLLTQAGTLAIMPTYPTPVGAPYDDGHTPVKAKVCIAEQGWAVVNVNAGTNAPPLWMIQFWDRVLDQSDLRIIGP